MSAQIDSQTWLSTGPITEATPARVPPLESPRGLGLGSFVGLLSLDGTLLEANRTWLVAADRNTGDDSIGRPFWESPWWSWSPAVQQRLRDAIAAVATGDMIRYDETARIARNCLVTVDFSLVPLARDGTVTALIASAIDLSAHRQTPHHPGSGRHVLGTPAE